MEAMKQLSPRGHCVGTGIVAASLIWYGCVTTYWWLQDASLPISKLLLAGFMGVVIAASVLSGIISAPVVLAFGTRQVWAQRVTAASLWLVLVWVAFRSEIASGFIPDRLFTVETVIAISGAIFGPIVGGLLSLPFRLRRIRIEGERRQEEIRQDFALRLSKLENQHTARRAELEAKLQSRSDEEERKRALRGYFRS